jgi:hypothetical protein
MCGCTGTARTTSRPLIEDSIHWLRPAPEGTTSDRQIEAMSAVLTAVPVDPDTGTY